MGTWYWVICAVVLGFVFGGCVIATPESQQIKSNGGQESSGTNSVAGLLGRVVLENIIDVTADKESSWNEAVRQGFRATSDFSFKTVRVLFPARLVIETVGARDFAREESVVECADCAEMPGIIFSRNSLDASLEIHADDREDDAKRFQASGQQVPTIRMKVRALPEEIVLMGSSVLEIQGGQGINLRVIAAEDSRATIHAVAVKNLDLTAKGVAQIVVDEETTAHSVKISAEHVTEIVSDGLFATTEIFAGQHSSVTVVNPRSVSVRALEAARVSYLGSPACSFYRAPRAGVTVNNVPLGSKRNKKTPWFIYAGECTVPVK